MKKIKKILAVFAAIFIFSLPYIVSAGQTPVPSNSGCDTGCYCVAGTHKGFLGCWGDNKWCTVDCRENNQTE